MPRRSCGPAAACPPGLWGHRSAWIHKFFCSVFLFRAVPYLPQIYLPSPMGDASSACLLTGLRQESHGKPAAHVLLQEYKVPFSKINTTL